MRNVLQPWVERWQALAPDRRRLFLTLGVSGLLAVVAAVVLLGRTPYTPILTNLSPAAAGQVTQALNTLKIPYRLADGGTTVLVPTAQADQARVDLAMQNLPATGQVGYQNLTGLAGAGMTPEQFSAAQLGILEQDLAATIAGFQGVQSATVQIAVPPQSVWAAPTPGGAKAAVYLNMAGGATPTPAEVQGIIALVSHAVPGLDPSGVTVVDQAGAVLSNTSPPNVNTPAGMFAEEAALDAQGEAKLRQLLGPMVGPNNLEVAVAVQIQPQHVTTTQTIPQPGQPTSVSQQSQSSNGTGSPTIPAGLSGNVPTYPAGTGGTSSSSSTSNQTQYAVGTVVRTTVGPPVVITGITASVVFNRKVLALTPGQANTIRQLVAGALGIPPGQAASRIVVSSAPFQLVPVPPAPTGLLALPRPVLYGAAAAVVVVGGLLVGFLGRRRKQPAAVAEPVPAPAVAEGPPPEMPRTRQLLQQLSDISTQAPQEVAALLTQWLEESE
ncbi:MAG: flagellar M-ring protein FliF [Actinomycetia bacterium]|nr:flagellar M-ring protein FliF [Actinomycetes bacterium]